MLADPLVLLAAASTSVLAGWLVFRVSPPPRPLHARVVPYLVPRATGTAGVGRPGALGRVFGPIVAHAARRLSELVERDGPEATLLRIRQAGWFGELRDDEALYSYRYAQFRAVIVATGLAGSMAWIIGLAPPAGIALALLGFVVGVTRHRGRLTRAIEERRELLRIEIYTVNQLLAMRIRAGGGVIQAVQACADRGRGHVVDELRQVLRLHRAGWRAADAFRRVATVTPEPFCSRTYRLLASAEERGSDLAGSLLALSEDVRETRREAIKRSATKRRAAMLIPTIAVLAPVLIIFVAAPLPYLITGWQ